MWSGRLGSIPRAGRPFLVELPALRGRYALEDFGELDFDLDSRQSFAAGDAVDARMALKKGATS